MNKGMSGGLIGIYAGVLRLCGRHSEADYYVEALARTTKSVAHAAMFLKGAELASKLVSDQNRAYSEKECAEASRGASKEMDRQIAKIPAQKKFFPIGRFAGKRSFGATGSIAWAPVRRPL